MFLEGLWWFLANITALGASPMPPMPRLGCRRHRCGRVAKAGSRHQGGPPQMGQAEYESSKNVTLCDSM